MSNKEWIEREEKALELLEEAEEISKNNEVMDKVKKAKSKLETNLAEMTAF